MLLNGGKLIICPESELLDVKLLKQTLYGQKVNTIWFTASWFNRLVETDITVFRELQTILVGGEKLSERHIMEFRNIYPDTTLINGYGPTENTTFSLTYDIKQVIANRTIPIGYPLAGRSTYIVDSAGHLCPVGITGELLVGGAGVARGYLNQPELTTRKFIPFPFRQGHATKLYRTGDLARWREDGSVEYISRIDNQVKVRGYRVELDEIAYMLGSYPGIASVVVITKDRGTEKEIAAYYKASSTVSADSLKAYLKDRLPAYMTPAYMIALDEIPVTQNGKVDKDKLPDPAAAGAGHAGQYKEATDETEQLLISIWEDILGRDGIGVTDDFFALGGNSLDAIRVVSNIAKHRDVQIELASIFECPTIKELSALIRPQAAGAYSEIAAVEPQPCYPLSHAQKRLWMVDQMDRDRSSYNIVKAHIFQGPLNRAALEKAFEDVVDRHEILRTVFITKSGEPYQQILSREAVGYRLEYLDLRSEANAEAKAMEISEAEMVRKFDLDRGPLIGTKLLQLEDAKYVFLLSLHHIVSDEWSLEVLVKEILLLYKGYDRNQPVKLDHLRIQYKDYAAWQNKMLSDPACEKHRSYWMQQLYGELQPSAKSAVFGFHVTLTADRW
jgi:acyl carrier protein